MTTQRRAQYDGEIGENGEAYKKGQFIATSDKTVKGSTKRKKGSGKEEISTYCWRVPPADNLRSIYTIIVYVCKWDGPTDYSKAEGKIGTLKLLEDVIITMYDTGQWRGDVEESLAKHRRMVEAWNSGLRWMTTDTWEPVE